MVGVSSLAGRASVDDKPRTFVILVGVSLLVVRASVDDRLRTFGLSDGVLLFLGKLSGGGRLLGLGGSFIHRWLQSYCWVLSQRTNAAGTGLQKVLIGYNSFSHGLQFNAHKVAAVAHRVCSDAHRGL